jgi:signal peptidase II
MPNEKKFNALHIWLAFVLSGTAGNMIDRIIYGNVIDMIYISKIDFPVFNLSDIFISLGTIFTIMIALFRLKEKDFEFLNFKQNKYREIK